MGKSDRFADPLEAARTLVPLVRELADEAERLRHMPPAMSEALAQSGLLQMFLPRGLGGQEIAPLDAFDAIEEISRADGSIGWCTMLATILTAFTGWLAPEVGRAIAGSPADLRMAGSIRPQGRARPVEGGYRIDGQWDFASGIHYARWLTCPCVILEGDRPALTPAGVPRTRIMWVAADDATILDTWDVVGLRGTGSHDFEVKDLFVAEAYSSSLIEPARHPGALYVPRTFFIWLWTVTVANAMGIARGALDTFTAIATTKSSTSSAHLLRDRPRVQAQTAQAEAALQSARAYVRDTVHAVWTRATRDEPDLDAAVLQARLAITHGMHEAARAVDIAFHAAGTNAVYRKNRLERYFRDIHVTLQHGAALHQHFEAAGQALLGKRPTDPGW